MLDLSEASFILEIENCSHVEAPIIKDNEYSASQNPKIEIEKDSMKDIPIHLFLTI